MTNLRLLIFVLAPASLALPSPAQGGRPSARVVFAVKETEPKNNYQVALRNEADREAIARMIEDKLFGVTFLRRAEANEQPRYTIVTRMEEDQGPEDFRPVYLGFRVEGLPAMGWEPPGDLEFRLTFRSEDQATREITTSGLRKELEAAIGELAKNRQSLIRGLLCYIPIARDQDTSRYCYLFKELDGEALEVRLPLRKDEIGLLPGSEFLLYVKSGDRRVFHLVKSDDLREFDPGTDLPEGLRDAEGVEYLKDGIVAWDALEELDQAAAREATAEIETGVQATTGSRVRAFFEDQIRLLMEGPRKRWRLKSLEDDQAEPRLVETLGIYIAACKSNVTSMVGAGRAKTSPTKVAGSGQ